MRFGPKAFGFFAKTALPDSDPRIGAADATVLCATTDFFATAMLFTVLVGGM